MRIETSEQAIGVFWQFMLDEGYEECQIMQPPKDAFEPVDGGWQWGSVFITDDGEVEGTAEQTVTHCRECGMEFADNEEDREGKEGYCVSCEVMVGLNEPEQVGFISVDAGLCWIGDPCYILHEKKPKDIGDDWEGFCDRLFERGVRAQQWKHDSGRDGLGVTVNTGESDGRFPVFVETDRDGYVTRIIVELAE